MPHVQLDDVRLHYRLDGAPDAPTLVLSNGLGTDRQLGLDRVHFCDIATTPEQGRFLEARIPGARRVELDAAHLSNVERPDEFDAAVIAHCSGPQAERTGSRPTRSGDTTAPAAPRSGRPRND